ncbi:MAG TPA: YggT family protein [Gemmatimonadaceae bacterium]|nr:YggT family protein [Gemmatimonadaceae bacterium]
MSTFLQTFDLVIDILRTAFLAAAVGVAGLCMVEWAVRTRRMHPFSALARTSRRVLAPLMKPVERRVLSAGGNPASSPWWTLIALVVVGIIVLQAMEFLRDQLANAYTAFGAGPRGVMHMVVRWTFLVFYIALLVRVISSWVGANQFRGFVRWAYVITEPLLAPVRRILPAMGMIDFSPLIAYFVLRVIESLLLKWL